MRQKTIKEYVDIIYPHYNSIPKIGLAIGATKEQMIYAIAKDTMKFELKQKLIKLSVKCQKEVKKI